MGRKHIDTTLKASPQLEKLMAGFRPRFGNMQDIAIMQAYEELQHLLTLAKKDDERRRELSKTVKAESIRRKEIKTKDKNLVWMIEQLSTKPNTSPQDATY